MNIENTIYIEAPTDVVWGVTMDIERWPEWTPTVTSIHRLDDRTFGPGSTVGIKQPGQPAAEWRVTDYIEGKLFS